MRSVLLGMLVVVVAGCSHPLSPKAVEGDWLQDTQVPGVVFAMSLTATGSLLTGSGNDCGEAMVCKAFTVNGTLDDNGEIRLAFAYANGVVPHFVGRLRFDTLSGEVTDGGQILRTVVFHRSNFIHTF